jgi:hypothetical protein
MRRRTVLMRCCEHCHCSSMQTVFDSNWAPLASVSRSSLGLADFSVSASPSRSLCGDIDLVAALRATKRLKTTLDTTRYVSARLSFPEFVNRRTTCPRNSGTNDIGLETRHTSPTALEERNGPCSRNLRGRVYGLAQTVNGELRGLLMVVIVVSLLSLVTSFLSPCRSPSRAPHRLVAASTSPNLTTVALLRSFERSSA